MQQNNLAEIIYNQTERALWEVQNVINCVPDDLWKKRYCEAPLWKHIYHMLHSLDLWFINPRDNSFIEPLIHERNLNNLDAQSSRELTRKEINEYYGRIENKITNYLQGLNDEMLLQMPPDCEYTKFTLILAQHRHLHSHMGMVMGFIIDDTGQWPRVLGLESDYPSEGFDKYF